MFTYIQEHKISHDVGINESQSLIHAYTFKPPKRRKGKVERTGQRGTAPVSGVYSIAHSAVHSAVRAKKAFHTS